MVVWPDKGSRWLRLLRPKAGLVGPLLRWTKMKASKLLAVLAFAGFCGTVETQARSHKFEIKHLERQRAERLEEHRDARERVSELSFQVNRSVAIEAETPVEADEQAVD